MEVGYFKVPRTSVATASGDAVKRPPGPGRKANAPSAIPIGGWKDILLRIWTDIGEDRILLIAAGTTFYLILALCSVPHGLRVALRILCRSFQHHRLCGELQASCRAEGWISSRRNSRPSQHRKGVP